MGLPIESIRQLLSEDDPGCVISLLLDQQESALKEDIEDREEKLRKLEDLRNGLKSTKTISVESIGDIAYTMSNKKKLKRMHWIMLLTGIPLDVLQWASIILWIVKGDWWLFVVWAVIAIPYAVLLLRWYFKKVSYLCPSCHTVFKPSFKEAFCARHTPSTRKLTCTSCGHHGFCVEVVPEKIQQ